MSDSEHSIDDLVRRRAYELWEAAGKPEGRGNEFWHEAWAEIAAEDMPASELRDDELMAASTSSLPANIDHKKSAS